MELGVAGTIATEHIMGDENIHHLINTWLNSNPDVEVIDIKFSSSAQPDMWGVDALIIYRKEV